MNKTTAKRRSVKKPSLKSGAVKSSQIKNKRPLKTMAILKFCSQILAVLALVGVLASSTAGGLDWGLRFNITFLLSK